MDEILVGRIRQDNSQQKEYGYHVSPLGAFADFPAFRRWRSAVEGRCAQRCSDCGVAAVNVYHVFIVNKLHINYKNSQLRWSKLLFSLKRRFL